MSFSTIKRVNDDITICTLSVEYWDRIAGQGVDLPVRFSVNGISMQPLIRRGRDYVTAVPLKRKPLAGDIVLFTNSERSRYVLHRVWSVENTCVMTWGDNCVLPDSRMPSENVLGIAVRLERGKKTLELDTDRARRAGMLLGKITHFVCKTQKKLRSLARCIPEPVKNVLKIIIGR